MTICLNSTRTYFQNMKLIEWFSSEIQVKHWCIIGWEFITAQYDLAVVHPKVIRFVWNFVRRIIKYITMSLLIYFIKKKYNFSILLEKCFPFTYTFTIKMNHKFSILLRFGLFGDQRKISILFSLKNFIYIQDL